MHATAWMYRDIMVPGHQKWKNKSQGEINEWSKSLEGQLHFCHMRHIGAGVRGAINSVPWRCTAGIIPCPASQIPSWVRLGRFERQQSRSCNNLFKDPTGDEINYGGRQSQARARALARSLAVHVHIRSLASVIHFGV